MATITPSINWSNISTAYDLVSLPNQNTGGFFWTAVAYLIWVVLLLALLPFGFEASIITASFIAFIISILLVYGQLMAWEGALFFLGILLFYIFYIIWSSSKTQN